MRPFNLFRHLLNSIFLVPALICVCAGVGLTHLSASAISFQTRKVAIEDGLSNNTVTSLVRDRRGFMWIGTNFGLNRDDRYRVTNYFHDPNDPHSIPHNNITALFYDSRNRLWVAGERGLALYNPVSNNFDHVKKSDGSQLFVRSFLEERDGVLLGSAKNLYFFENATGKVKQLPTRGGSNVYYTDIVPISASRYLLATRWDGVWEYNRHTGEISRLPWISERAISAIFLDSKHRLWISPYGKGVLCFSLNGRLLNTLNTSNSGLTNNIILDISNYQDQIWMATDGGGINVYNPESNIFNPPALKPVQESVAAITTLYADTYGNMYAGTVHEGCLWVQRVAMRTIQNTAGSIRRWKSVNFILQGSKPGEIWCGLDGDGLVLHRETDGSFTEIPSTAGLKVTGIAPLNDNQLLISTFDKGFFNFDTNTRTLTPTSAPLTHLWQRQAHRGLGFQLASLAPNAMAIISDSLTIFNPSTKLLTSIHVPGVNKTGNMRLIHNKDGRIICMGYTGIYQYRLGQKNMEVLHHDTVAPEITAAAFDGNRYLYVARNNLVQRFNLNNLKQKPTEIKVNGPRRISAMTVEGSRLWLGDINYLYMRPLDKHNTIWFNNFDGVIPNEYFPASTVITPEHIFIGGINGLLQINRKDVNSMLQYDSDITINLANIEIDGQTAYNLIQPDETVKIPSDYRQLKISIIDQERNTMRRKMFRYYINSTHNSTCIETFDHTIALNRLNPGTHYTIEVSCRNNDGGWSSPQRVASLYVRLPWWRSWWAILCYLLVIASGIIIYLKALKRRQANSVRIQLDAARNADLKKQVGFMVNTAYSLQTPLTMIYAPVKLLIEQIEKGVNPPLLPELKSIYQNSKRMRDVINMALELHDVNETTQSALAVSQFNDDVTAAINACAVEIDIKKLNINLHTDNSILPIAYDSARIGNALRLLMEIVVRHAVEHSNININTFNLDDHVRIEVSTPGEHLTDEEVQQLFSQSFVGEHSSFGLGLELAYIKSVIDECHGHLGVRNNEKGSGVTFWADIPKMPSNADSPTPAEVLITNAEVKSETHPSVVDNAIMTNEFTAVVVEEDHELCLFITAHLKLYFKRVLHAFNGKDAMLLIRQHQPDIVISSVMLPVHSGVDLCRDIKASAELSHIPVILLTALREERTMELCYNAGADSFLVKPFDMQVLLSRCRNLLHTRSVIRRRYASNENQDTTNKPASQPATISNSDENFLRKIDDIIMDNMASPDMGVEMIVDRMNMSRSSLYNRFKDLTGKSIGAHINDLRLLRAKTLLQNRNLTINEIAELTGFGSQRYFSNFFKEKTGMSPSQFRKQA